MEITISGSIKHGPSWEAIQRLITSMLHEDCEGDCVGRLRRIARRCGKGANYRQTFGIYDLEYIANHGGAVEVTLYVNRAS